VPPRKKYAKLLTESAKVWQIMFEKNENIIHLDISHNEFDARELVIMKQGLDENHKIIGLHITGNEADIDQMGFMQPHDADGIRPQEDVSRHFVFTRIQPSYTPGHHTQHRMSLKAASNCWICEGWSEYKFEVIPPTKIDEKTVPVYLHLSTDDY
jgi:hypothetical protein